MGGKLSALDPMEVDVPDLKKFLEIDPYLKPHERELRKRYAYFKDVYDKIFGCREGLTNFTRGYQFFGIQVNVDHSVSCQEWAPNATELYLYGEYTNWDKESQPYSQMANGIWELHIPPNPDGTCPIPHLSEVKLWMKTKDGQYLDRISPWATYVKQPPPSEGYTFKQRMWNPPAMQKFRFKHREPKKPKSMRIYECHIGIATKEPKVGTYKEFIKNVIPRIVTNGYNAIQLMGIMEHAYYASFGYLVTSFFAPSSRFGTPDELKELVDIAHANGLYVIIDVVHSHAAKNVLDGINQFDGTTKLFFHEGPRGDHPSWGSKIFNYAQDNVLKFLLSNLIWWKEEYKFDGYRFDGVTSMLYHSHGISKKVPTSYDDYFNLDVDHDGIMYLMLANYILHKEYPEVTTIAEEVSGMPGACRPVNEGGLGFDYRLAMSIPDMWVKYLKETRDEDWNIGHIAYTLTNRRYMEKTVAYAECHDQSLVGDKTIAFWLMDKEMYTHMSTLSEPSHIIDRGLALHKMIRMLTHTLGGEGYLNFMGNEFGHPEWLDFPRAGNNDSYHYARRQWNLVDDKLLKYKFLNNFDILLNAAEDRFGWLHKDDGYVSLKHEDDKILAFERAQVLFVFNFHPTKSYTDYRLGVDLPGAYKVFLNTDAPEFGGHNRIDVSVMHVTDWGVFNGRKCSIQLYIPSRVGMLLARV